MKNFIYVFDATARDHLLKAGFLLLKEDKRNGVYVFRADDCLSYALGDISYLTSDTLSF